MPSLDILLMDTMLGTAAPNPQWQYEIEPFPQARKPLPFDKNYADAFYKDAPIWSFDGPRLTSSGIEVKDVRCKARGMDNMQMPVMESIEWPPVVVNSILYGEKITLPLKNDFFLRSRYVERGSINIGKPSGGQSLNTGFWQLPAKIDQSFEMVFGYEIPVPLPGSALAEKSSMSSAVKPLSTAELSSPCLFPIPICSVFPTDPGNSSIATLRVPPLRIVVVFSLVCCKERYDFIPHGLVGTARLYPW